MEKYYVLINDEQAYYDILKDHRKFSSYLKKNTNAYGKSFTSYEQAKTYLENHVKAVEKALLGKTSQCILDDRFAQLKLNDDEIVAYTDASYDPETKEYATAHICLSNRYGYREYSEKHEKKDYEVTSSNIAEMKAILEVIEKAIDLKYKKITVYTDNLNALDMMESTFQCATMLSKIKIIIKYVKAHDNNFYNEICDKLAKNALSSNAEDYKQKNSLYDIDELQEDSEKTIIDVLEIEIEKRKESIISLSKNPNKTLDDFESIENFKKIIGKVKDELGGVKAN